MGEIEVHKESFTIYIHSFIYLYGESSSDDLAKRFGEEIESLWNEADGIVNINDDIYKVVFRIVGSHMSKLTAEEIQSNTNPRNNYYRVEDYSPLNISWVDGLNSNTGYMLVDNLYEGSTTGAHEYGHSLGLDHPKNLNIIGKGRPGIMYPRGTLVDPEFQYDPNKQPGENGGTVHPMHRRVNQEDIELLNLSELVKYDKKFIGNFSSIYHPKHIKPLIT